jgi:ammonia channel protein AmtB
MGFCRIKILMMMMMMVMMVMMIWILLGFDTIYGFSLSGGQKHISVTLVVRK